jgi:UPF0042 nucleotide-binding protein
MAERKKFTVNLVSFGFKHGSIDDVNFIWDVRFLPNPYWVDELRPKNGLDNSVSDYVVASSEGHSFIKLLKPMLLFLIQQNIAAKKETLAIAVGCTGGKHRSVAVVEVLKDILQMMPVELTVHHRDIEKES